MARLHSLPYEILHYIFEDLDRKSLNSASLASRALNELASKCLYTNITINFARIEVLYGARAEERPKRLVPVCNPFDAFSRRPELRKRVRRVKLCAPYSRYLYADKISTDHAVVCCQELSLLRGLETMTITCELKGEALDALAQSISGLQLLQEVDCQSTLEVLRGVSTVQRFAIWWGNLHQIHSFPNITSRIYKVKCRWTPWMIIDQTVLSFPRLRELEGGGLPQTLPELCSSLSIATNLTHLKFRLTTSIFQFDNLVPEQSGLTKLVSLTILVYAKHPNFNEDLILNVVEGLASKSRLRNLSLPTRNARPPVLHSQKLVTHIVRTHTGSLQKLRIPLFTTSKSTMIQILRGLPYLTHLWIAVTYESRNWIPDVLSLSRSLEKLRLYGPGTWLISYARGLLLQAAQNLLAIKACRSCHRDYIEKVAWKVYWEYDCDLRRAVRQINGPLECEIAETRPR
ncbi:hypothetical protein FRC20_011247 [Serendipita sp. 405]|nr:hypothetical protein FRC16_010694 [Serendipita sp. 398]KAG8862367.1 hypothetical protein FRC20_011247 [Serendipita sp. 405]